MNAFPASALTGQGSPLWPVFFLPVLQSARKGEPAPGLPAVVPSPTGRPSNTIAFRPFPSVSEDFPNSRGAQQRPLNRSSHAGDAVRSAASEDGALLARVGQGDQQAMAEIFDRYGSMVYSVALRVLKDPGSAEDVMQEIFFQVWQNPRAFVPGRGSLGGWLLVVARNRAVDQLRRRRPTDSVDEVVLAAENDVAEEAERRTMMDKVRAVLDHLPVEQRQMMELAYFEGLSHSEIAAQTGDPLGTVKTRIRSALTSVRKAFQT